MPSDEHKLQDDPKWTGSASLAHRHPLTSGNTLPSYDLTITQDAENLPAYNRIAVNQSLTAGIDVNYRFGK